MKLSIIIPVYNCEEFIAVCLESCLTQDISKDEYEILCIDDCSTDGSLAVLQDYEERYSNIRVFYQEKNQGVSAARNVGIEHMQGKYCWFLDGDDFIADKCLFKVIQILNSGCDILSVGRATFQHYDGISRSEGVRTSEYKGANLAGYLTSRIIRSSLLEGLLFHPDVAYGEDELLLLEIMQKNPKCLELDEAVYFYRLHPDQAMSLSNTKRLKRIDSVIYSAKYLLDNYSPCSEKALKFIDSRFDCAYRDIQVLDRNLKKKKIKALKEAGLFDLQNGAVKIGLSSRFRADRKNKAISIAYNVKLFRNLYRKFFKRK